MVCDLTIGISTCTDDLDPLLVRVNEYFLLLNKRVRFLVVWQCGRVYEQAFEWGRVIYIKERGLSRNRNECIRQISSGWYWVQDDDIELDVVETKKLLKLLPSSRQDLLLVRIRSLECPSQNYKSYPEQARKIRAIPFKVSSIELITRIDFLAEKNIWFDENLGLGTEMPCCEENLFTHQMVQQGAKVLDTKLYACLHTTEQAGRQVKGGGHFLARGYFLSRVNRIIAMGLMARWSMRELKGLGVFKSFGVMLKGYLRGIS